MISRKYKCIYICIPKCAGSTIRNYFADYAGVWPYYNGAWNPLVTGRRLTEAINLFPDYFTFTFVRNPFDRFVSYYFFGANERKARNLPPAYYNLRECALLTAELLEAKKRGNIQPDDQFGPHRTEFRHLGYEIHHARPQVDYLLDRHPKTYFGVKRFNDAPCSFIGRCETFERDFFRLTDLLGAPRRPVERRNFSKERLENNLGDGNRRKHYSTYYDDATRRLVEDLYAEDLQVLGYEFEDENVVGNLPPPPPLYIALKALRELKQCRQTERSPGFRGGGGSRCTRGVRLFWPAKSALKYGAQ